MKTIYSLLFKNLSKGIIILILYVACLGNSFAGWRNAPVTSIAPLDIMFVNATVGYIVGNSGYILKTTDGGASWQSLELGNASNLNAVHFITATEGYVGGSAMYKTTDGGTTWVQIDFGGLGSVQAIYFANSSTGWISTTNGEIFNTTDGGGTWFSYYSGPIINSMHFTSATTGWAVGNSNTVLKTTDGGITWTPLTFVTGTTYLVDAEFISPTIGWISSYDGNIYRTTDGGATWAFSAAPVSVYDASFVSSSVGFIATNSGVYKTTDGGVTWVSGGLSSPIIYKLCFSSLTNGVAAYYTGVNYHTTNTGSTWTALSATLNTNTNIYGVYFSDANTAYNVGSSGTVKKSTDGGNTWTNLTSGTIQTILTVNFPSASTGWFAGLAGVISKTTNSGATWTAQTSGTTNALYASTFFSTTSGFIVGDLGKILKTVDGTSWTSVTSGTTNALRSIYFANASTGWIVGHGGTILATTDAGVTWTAQTSGTVNNLLSVHFVNTTTGYIVGASGTMLKTTNGGTTWTTLTSGVTDHLTSCYFTSATDGWAVGYACTIMHTGNGGTTWTLSPKYIVSQPINQVFFISPTNAYAVGNGGTEYQYSTNCTPSAPVNYTYINDANVCVNTPAKLKAGGIGKISWYSAASGGTYLGSGSTLVTAPLTVNKTYYAQDSTCAASVFRTAISVTASAPPTISSTSPNSVCSSGNMLLGATSLAGNVSWFSASTGGNPIATGNSFTTPSITSTTAYYAEAQIYGCKSTSRTTINATVIDLPTITSSTQGYFCVSGTASLSAIPSAGNVSWYVAPSGGVAIGTGNNFTTPVINSTTLYYAEVVNSGCISAARTAVSATLNTVFPSVATTVSNHVLNATQSGNTYQWINCYNSNSIIVGETSQNFAPTITGSYAVIVNKNGCIDTSNCRNVTVTGIEEKSADGIVSVYPIPATDIVTIEEINNALEGAATIKLMDVMGNTLLHSDFKNSASNLELSSFPSGMYFIEIESNGNYYRKSIMKR